jgi:hypothetical protein
MQKLSVHNALDVLTMTSSLAPTNTNHNTSIVGLGSLSRLDDTSRLHQSYHSYSFNLIYTNAIHALRACAGAVSSRAITVILQYLSSLFPPLNLRLLPQASYMPESVPLGSGT